MTTIDDSIEQADPVLCEDGLTVMFVGHTANDDLTFIAAIALPQPITEAEFESCIDEWRSVPWGALDWRQA